MTEEQDNSRLDQYAGLKNQSAQFVERRYQLKDVHQDGADYALPLLASDVSKVRENLTELSKASFGWTEILLAGASLALGAFLGILPTDLKVTANLISILYYSVLPGVGFVMLVAYFLMKNGENASTRQVAMQLLDRLPNLPVPSDATISMGIAEHLVVQSTEELDRKLTDSPEKKLALDDGKLNFELWSDDEFERRYAFALIGNRDDQAVRIDRYQRSRQEFQESSFARRWESETLYWKIVLNKGGSFDALKALADDDIPDPTVCANIASVYKSNKEYESAADWFSMAAAHSQNLIEKIRFLSRAAERMFDAGNIDGAMNLYDEVSGLGASTTEEIKVRIDGAKNLLELQQKAELEVAVLEYRLQVDPTDQSTRFSVAYKHSQLGRKKLAAYHYSLIPISKRDSRTWNNLGVAWSELDVQASAAEAYLKAHEMGDTLASSNLANMMIDAGLRHYAKDVIAKAISAEHDVRLDRSVVRLEEEVKRDEKKMESLLKEIRPQSVFYKELGRAAILTGSKDMAGTYIDSEYELSLQIDGGKVIGKARKIAYLNKLATAVNGNSSNTSASQEFSVGGDITGAAAVLNLRSDSQSSSLLSASDQGVILLVIFSNGESLRCLEESQTGKWTLRTLTRKSLTEVTFT